MFLTVGWILNCLTGLILKDLIPAVVGILVLGIRISFLFCKLVGQNEAPQLVCI